MNQAKLIQGKYRKLKDLAIHQQGAQASVFLAENVQDSTQVLVKVPEYTYSQMIELKKIMNATKEQEHLKSEIRVLELLTNSQHCVKILGSEWTNDEAYIILEYLNGGTLREYLPKNNSILQEEEAVNIVLEISRGLKDIHNLGCGHRDLKPENIMCDRKNGQITWKIIDMGLVNAPPNEIATGQLQNTFCGTGCYMAPELYNPDMDLTGYNPKISDVFSLGVIMYEMIFGVYPFDLDPHKQGLGASQVIEEIINGRRTLTFPLHIKSTQFIQQVLSGMLEINPDKRMTLDQFIYLVTEGGKKQRYQKNSSTYTPSRAVDLFEKTYVGYLLFDRYEILELKKNNDFRRSYLAYDNVEKKKVLMKMYSGNLSTPNAGQQSLIAYDQLIHFENDHVIKVEQIHTSDVLTVYVSDFLDGQPLLNYIFSKPQKKIDEGEAMVFFMSLLSAYQTVYSINVRDILIPFNHILIYNNQLKVTGFIQKLKQPLVSGACFNCDIKLIAPEYFGPYSQHSNTASIYCLGKVLDRMVVTEQIQLAPIAQNDNQTLYRKQPIKQVNNDPKINRELSPQINQFILRLIASDPKDRLTFPEIYDQPLVANFNNPLKLKGLNWYLVSINPKAHKDFYSSIDKQIFFLNGRRKQLNLTVQILTQPAKHITLKPSKEDENLIIELYDKNLNIIVLLIELFDYWQRFINIINFVNHPLLINRESVDNNIKFCLKILVVKHFQVVRGEFLTNEQNSPTHQSRILIRYRNCIQQHRFEEALLDKIGCAQTMGVDVKLAWNCLMNILAALEDEQDTPFLSGYKVFPKFYLSFLIYALTFVLQKRRTDEIDKDGFFGMYQNIFGGFNIDQLKTYTAKIEEVIKSVQ